MKRLFILALCAVCATAGAQVYKRIGPDGQVYFSDQPGPDAEPVEISPPSSVTMRPVPRQTRPEQAATPKEAAGSYERFAIVSPANGEGVRANNGNVAVTLSLKPGLKPGHSIALNVEGENGQDLKIGAATTFELNNLSRGRHTLTASVLDAQGNEVIQTGPVSFHVLRVALGGRGAR